MAHRRKQPSTSSVANPLPKTWRGLLSMVATAPIRWVKHRYTRWIKFLVAQRLAYLSKLDAATHNRDTFVSASQAMYSLPREVESPAEKAAKEAWRNLQAQHRLQQQGREMRQQVDEVYQLQQAMQQRIHANSVGRAQSNNFSNSF